MAIDRIRNTKVILDTNALFMPFQFNINLDYELTRLLGDYDIIIPSSVLAELQILSNAKPKPKWVDAAISLAQKFRMLKVSGHGDEAVFDAAKKINAIVVTNDKILKKRLKSNGLKSISLRSRKYLILD